MPLNSFAANTTIESAKVNENFQGLADGSLMNSPVIADATLNQFVGKGFYDNGNSGASKTIDWSNGDRQKVTISAACVLAFSNAQAGQIITIYIAENGTGNYSITLPTVKWPNGGAGVFTTTAGAINTLTVMYDGSNYLAQLAPGYA